MGDAPWQGDACSLVEAFRRGERSPAEELEAVYAAIDASPLNAFCHLDREHATIAAGVADVAMPFGGVPIGVKELDQVAGWPHSMASVPLRDEIATATSTQVQRIRDLGGAVLAGQTHVVGVRRRQRHPHRAARRDPQPVAARPHPGRLVRRLGGGGRRRDRHAGHGRRRRRVDPHPGRLLRAGRAEDDVRPGADVAATPTTAT